MMQELTAIADDMDRLLALFVNGGNMSGLILPTQHSAAFKALALEAKSILDAELIHANDYSLNLIHAINSAANGFTSGPSYASVQESSQIIRAGARAIQRKRATPSANPPGVNPYVDTARILALQQIGAGTWDFTRLVELCRELNVAAANRCHMSTAMLLRTILNHVPPTLGFETFAQVASNYAGGKSFKASMQRLEGSSRNISDMHLHMPIRSRETLPSAVQVDFAADLDVLLSEVIRLSQGA